MNVHGFVKRWMLPPMMYRSLGQAYFDYVNWIPPENRYAISKNVQFSGKYAGRRCFIIGNGSSLSDIDLPELNNDITIAMNRIYLNSACNRWKPTFYCAVDRMSELDTTEGRDFLLQAVTRVHPTDGNFFHISLKHYIEDVKNWYPVNKFYVGTSVAVDTITDIRKNWTFDRNIPGCRSTSQMAIMLAMYLGCNPIYLLGMDSDWLTHRGIDRHFYGGDSFDSDLGKTPYTDVVAASLRQFRGYKVIRKYADYRGITILNATKGSFLDAFPFVNYEDIVGGKK